MKRRYKFYTYGIRTRNLLVTGPMFYTPSYPSPLVVVVIVGLYVFFHHEGDFKDGNTKERAVQTLPQRDSNPQP